MARSDFGINRSNKKTAIASVLLGVVLIAAGTLFSIRIAQAQAPDCGEWQRSTFAYLAPGDLYRVCGDELQVLITEDGHDTMTTHLANVIASSPATPATPDCTAWQRSAMSTDYLAPDDLHRVCGDALHILIVEDDHGMVATYPIQK